MVNIEIIFADQAPQLLLANFPEFKFREEIYELSYHKPSPVRLIKIYRHETDQPRNRKMTKKRYTRNELDIQKLLSQGRGQGVGEKYSPYLFVRDVPSCGRSHRIYSRLSGRVLHLLSDIEYAHCLTFDMDESIIDIREQFALSRADTIRIASTLGFRHPKDPTSDTKLVMTTDLLITYKNTGPLKHKAISIKPASQIEKPRIREKLKIEEMYWVEKGIQFQILTERDIPLHLKRSLQWLRQYQDLSHFVEPSHGYFNNLAQNLIIRIHHKDGGESGLANACSELDDQFAHEPGAHLMIARHLLSTRVLQTNLNREQIWNTPISEIKLNSKINAYQQLT